VLRRRHIITCLPFVLFALVSHPNQDSNCFLTGSRLKVIFPIYSSPPLNHPTSPSFLRSLFYGYSPFIPTEGSLLLARYKVQFGNYFLTLPTGRLHYHLLFATTSQLLLNHMLDITPNGVTHSTTSSISPRQIDLTLTHSLVLSSLLSF